MNHWLYPANTKFYDVIGALNQAYAYWPQHSKVAVGDLVFFYLASPYKQIGYVARILSVDHELNEVLGEVKQYFRKELPSKKSENPFMKMQTELRIPLESNSSLGLEQLRENGLNGMLMGARKLENNPVLLEYINHQI